MNSQISGYIQIYENTYKFEDNNNDLMRIILFSIKNQINLQAKEIKFFIENKDQFIKDFNESKRINSEYTIDVRIEMDQDGDGSTKIVRMMSEEAKKDYLCVPYIVCVIVIDI
jgi:hypothetical protein